MSTQRWERIQEIFEAAIELPAAKREQYLKEQCGEDKALFEEVISLIEADEAGHPIFDSESAIESLSLGGPAIGSKVGSFLLKSQIGEGGMGAVYLADRVEGGFEQQVALKIVRPDLGASHIIRRFRQERQILARLKHPHIAQLIDGGLTEDGRPYIAMEHVDGVPIDRYCRENNLDLEARLKLFSQACSAVEYAHSNLVIHRDIKPANILVSKRGNVKLLDFGIAKIVEGSEPVLRFDNNLTQTGFRALTPRYASPEQLRSEAVTTASDVYSLGVVLYELLTGLSPYKTGNAGSAELEQLIITQEPERPSSVVAKSENGVATDSGARHKLARKLRGDLDTICVAALRKDPTRRYQTVQQLDDDINRYLTGRPIQARMDSFAYTFGKFVKRNTAAVSAIGVALVLLIGTIVFYTRQLSEERDNAKLEQAKANEVVRFLTDVFSASDPNVSSGEEVTARELLDSASVRLSTELANQPEIQSLLMFVAADIYYQLGLLDDANRLGFAALETRSKLPDTMNVDYIQSLGQMALFLDDAGAYDSALTMARREYLIAREIFKDPDSSLATAEFDVAFIQRHMGEFDSAEVHYRNVERMQRATVSEMNGDLANTVNHLARLEMQRGNYDKAEPLVREALEMQRKIFGTDDSKDVIATLGNLGGILYRLGKYAAAESTFTHALACVVRIEGAEHPDVVGLTNQLAVTLLAEGKIEAAHGRFKEAYELGLRNMDSTQPRFLGIQLSYANFLLKYGDFRDAEPMLRNVVNVRRESLPPNHWITATSESVLADCLRLMKKYDEGSKLAVESYKALYDAFGAEDQRTIDARSRLDTLYHDWGKPLPNDLPG